MRVFVTGATGFIGFAVVQELIAAGHKVLGLARSDTAAGSLITAGAEVHRGSLDDLESLRAGAAASDGVIHAAFIHDFSAYAAAAETDRRAVEVLGDSLQGSGKPLVSTSVTFLLAPGQLGTEKDDPFPGAPSSARIASERTVLSMASRGVRASVVRLPPSVHGAGDHGFVPALIGIARKGGATFVGDGTNRWPAVHRLDAARLFRLGLEKAAAGTRLHAVADEGIPMRAIAEAIAEGLGIPVRSIATEEASAHFGWLARFVAVDNPTSSALTRDSVGWQAIHAGLLTDIREGGYFSGS